MGVRGQSMRGVLFDSIICWMLGLSQRRDQARQSMSKLDLLAAFTASAQERLFSLMRVMSTDEVWTINKVGWWADTSLCKTVEKFLSGKRAFRSLPQLSHFWEHQNHNDKKYYYQCRALSHQLHSSDGQRSSWLMAFPKTQEYLKTKHSNFSKSFLGWQFFKDLHQQ